jgi:hypothetical protein
MSSDSFVLAADKSRSKDLEIWGHTPNSNLILSGNSNNSGSPDLGSLIEIVFIDHIEQPAFDFGQPVSPANANCVFARCV